MLRFFEALKRRGISQYRKRCSKDIGGNTMRGTDLKELLRSKSIRIGDWFSIPIDPTAHYGIPGTNAQYSLRIKRDIDYIGKITNETSRFVDGFFTGIVNRKGIQLLLKPTPFEVWIHGFDGWRFGADVLDNMCKILYGSSQYNIYVRCMREKDWNLFPFSLRWKIKAMQENSQGLYNDQEHRIIVPSKWKEREARNSCSYGWYEIKNGNIKKMMIYYEEPRGRSDNNMFYEGVLLPVMWIPTNRYDIEADKSEGKFEVRFV